MREIYPIVKDTYYKRSNTKFYIRDAVRAFIFKENKFCLLHILGIDAFGSRDHYETPGGGIEKGEDQISALKREISEECGFEIKNIQEIGKASIEYNLLNRIDNEFYYYAELDNIHETNLLDYEKKLTFSPTWFTIDEALKMYKTKKESGCGKMIHEREFNVLLYLKRQIIEEKIKVEGKM